MPIEPLERMMDIAREAPLGRRNIVIDLKADAVPDVLRKGYDARLGSVKVSSSSYSSSSFDGQHV